MLDKCFRVGGSLQALGFRQTQYANHMGVPRVDGFERFVWVPWYQEQSLQAILVLQGWVHGLVPEELQKRNAVVGALSSLP